MGECANGSMCATDDSGRNFGELTHLMSYVHNPFIQQIESNEYQCTAKEKKLRRERHREVNIR